jgi:copper homeostasis protein
MLKSPIQIEVCAYSLESCLNAKKAGANRIELCSGIFEGGTTPSYGLVKQALKSVDLDIFVMVRPRGGDFFYSKSELNVIYSDIQELKKTNIQGIVIGILKRNGEVDKKRLKEIVEISYPLKVTFHRAIDITPDPFEALEIIIDSGCNRILTSGQKQKAIEGLETIKKLKLQANNKIEIMAGSGININNAKQFIEIKIDALHLSASSYKPTKMVSTNNISMSSMNNKNESKIQYAQIKKIKEIVALTLT